jgi:hypothetical protein
MTGAAVSGLVSTVAQQIQGLKTFVAGIISPSVANTNGTGASDVCVKVGTTTADGSVNGAAKLLSVRAGIGGSEIESINFLKGGYMAGAGGGATMLLSSVAQFAQGANLIRIDGTHILFGSGLGWLFKMSASGEWLIYGTDSSASPGAATINKPTGISAIAGGATSVVITNSIATTTMRVNITWLGDLGAQSKVPWVTRAAGSFTVNVGTAPAGAVAFSWELAAIL